MAKNMRLNSGPKRRVTPDRTLWVTVKYLEYGRTRIELPAGLYHKAHKRSTYDDKLLPGGNGCRKRICLEVRGKFNGAGLNTQFIYWSELKFSEVSYQPGHPEDGKTVIYQYYVNTFDDDVRAMLDQLPPATEAQAAPDAMELFPATYGRQTVFEDADEDEEDRSYGCGCTGSLPPVTTM